MIRKREKSSTEDVKRSQRAERHNQTSKKDALNLAKLQILAFVAVALVILIGQRWSKDDKTIPLVDATDDEVFNRTRREIARFRQTSELPTFGLTPGRYHYMVKELRGNSAHRLKARCHYDPANNTKPPVELLVPGQLSSRADLTERSLCFLWYCAEFWTRPMGGKKGLMLTRIGAGIDDKSFLRQAIMSYEQSHNCKPDQVTAPTVDLNETDKCFVFFRHNDKWAAKPESLWFIKAKDGSTGRHISLLRRADVERIAASGNVTCPIPGGIASLEVPNLWVIGNKKFDHRVFVLVASFEPLVVLFRKGHLRFSVFNYSDPFREPLELNVSFYTGRVYKDRMTKAILNATADKLFSGPTGYPVGKRPEDNTDLSRHLTNPRFAFAHTNNTNEVIRPAEGLRRALVSEHGDEAGNRRWEKMLASVKSACLTVIYAIQDKFKGREYMTRWGFMMIAMDVVYDTDGNAKVIDINSGPDFYHDHKYPLWFHRERSGMIREALDIVQETAFLKATQRSELKMRTPDKWELLFHEKQGGPTTGLQPLGSCPHS